MDTILIWGAAGGIGRALVDVFRRENWRVLAVARDAGALTGLGIATYEADVTREDDVAAASLWAAREAGEAQLWVYAAGDILARPLAETSAGDWERIMAANLGGAQLAVRHSLPAIAKGGHLVFIGAYVERIMLPGLGAYAAAKAGLEAYTRVLTKELRDKRITLVRVGAVATPLWDKVPFNPPKQGTLPPEDVATAVLKAYGAGHKGVLDL
jgi:NAD(P)-dependent dehydrogenase (short-subunit alcohol dehydrogenase family)